MENTAGFLILIVDDFQIARHTLRSALTLVGYTEFLEAANGKEALEVLERQAQAGKPVSLVTCDVNMPPHNGIEFLKSVRAKQNFKNLPVVMVTVESEMAMIRDALMHGANDYIVKPYSAELIGQKMQRLFKKKAS